MTGKQSRVDAAIALRHVAEETPKKVCTEIETLATQLDDHNEVIRRNAALALQAIAREHPDDVREVKPSLRDGQQQVAEDRITGAAIRRTLALIGEPRRPSKDIAETNPSPSVSTDDLLRIQNDTVDVRLDSLSYDQIEKTGPVQGCEAGVYSARVRSDTGFRTVVLKEPELGESLNEQLKMRFLQQIRLWGAISEHPHVVDLLAWGETPHPWLVTESLDGRKLAGHATLEPDEALWMCARLADALAQAHQTNLRHLNLRPSNILLHQAPDNPWDVPKITDWGLGRLQSERPGQPSPTPPQYRAPEQFDADAFGDVGVETDHYQLGVLLYQFTTGQHPFPDREDSIATEHLRAVPTMPGQVHSSIPSELDRVVRRLLQPQPEDRYDSAAVVRNELDRIRTESTRRSDEIPTELADLYAKQLEPVEGKTLREYKRWAEEVQKFVRQNPLKTDEYDQVLEQVRSLTEERLSEAIKKKRELRGRDVVLDAISEESPELAGDIQDVATAVRQLYIRNN